MIIKIIILLLAITVLVCMDAVVIVHTNEAAIIERLGSKQAVYSNKGEGRFPSIKWKLPLIDRVVDRIPLRDQHQDYHPRDMTTSDNVGVIGDLIVYFRIESPEIYHYNVVRPLYVLEEMAYATLRPIIGAMEFDETLTAREAVNEKMMSNIGNTERLGITVIYIDLQRVRPIDPDFKKAMDKQAVAERERRATEIEAAGKAKAMVTMADANKEAAIKEAEANAKIQEIKYAAIAAGIKMITNAGGTTNDALRVQQFDTMVKVADGKATKVVIPSDVPSATTLTALTSAAAMVAKAEQEE